MRDESFLDVPGTFYLFYFCPFELLVASRVDACTALGFTSFYVLLLFVTVCCPEHLLTLPRMFIAFLLLLEHCILVYVAL